MFRRSSKRLTSCKSLPYCLIGIQHSLFKALAKTSCILTPLPYMSSRCQTELRYLSVSLVRYVIFAIFLSKLILLAFWPSWGSNKPKILGFNLSHPSTPPWGRGHLMPPFSKRLAPSWICHILTILSYTITNFVYEPMFLIMRNVLVYVKVILEWQPSWKSNMAPRKCDR